ncbi:MAG: leucine-rich repeat domain-containing protein [Clostridiales bacterium]|nr:leucine-rich repeat domain-containing protein [Clostridiales bacterium]
MKKKIPALLFSILLITLTIFFIASCSDNNKTTGSTSVPETTNPVIYDKDFEIEGTVLKKYKGTDTVVSVPDGVKTIATYAFTNSKVKTVSLPESVLTIDRYAFFNCETIENVTVPSSCVEIQTGAFIGCSSLKSVTFSDTKDWIVSIKDNQENGTKVDLTDPSSNAEMLSGKYMTYFWFKSGAQIETTTVTDASETETTEITETETVETTEEITTTETDTDTTEETTTEETTEFVEIPVALPENYSKFRNIQLGDDLDEVKKTVGGLYETESKGTYTWYTMSYYQGKTTYGTLSVKITKAGAEKITYTYGKELRYYVTTERDVTISEDVTSIGDSAFSGNVYMKTLILPRKIEKIGQYAFMDCLSLETIDISSGLKSVGMYAFIGCKSLKSVYITDLAAWCEISFSGPYSNPLSVAHQLFNNGKLISSLTIPSSVETIGQYTFYGSSTLLSVTIPSTVKFIEPFAFAGCPNLSGVTFETKETWYITSSLGTEGTIVDVSYSSKNDNYLSKDYTSYYWYLGEKPVSNRMDYNFDYTKLALDMSVSQVKAAVGFDYSSRDEKENKYYWYSDGYYEGINEYSVLVISTKANKVNEITFVKDRTIVYYNSLEETVKVTDKAKYIGQYAYANNTLMKELVIPDTIKEIRSNAFASCTSLKNVTVGEAVRTIMPRAFYGCSALEKVTFKTAGGWRVLEGSEETGTSIFVTNEKNAATNLRSTYMTYTWVCSNAKTEYMSDTYNKYTYLVLGQSLDSAVETLGFDYDAVEGMTYIWYSENYHEGNSDYDILRLTAQDNRIIEIEYIDGTILTFWSGTLTEYTVNEKVTSIGSAAFYCATSLEKINLTKKVTTIGSRAFYGCTSLKSMNMPSSVESIGINAFEGCTSLDSVSFENANNWYVSKEENALTGIDVKLNNTKTNAALLNSTYLDYYWYIVSGFNYIADDFEEYTNIKLGEKMESVRAKVGSEPTSMEGETYYWLSVGYYLGKEDYAVLSVTFDDLSVCEVQFVSAKKLTYVSTNRDKLTFNKYATSTADSLLANNSYVKEVTVPEGFTELAQNCFAGCSVLETVSLPQSLNLIKPYAFRDCSKLKSVTFANSEQWAVSDDSSLESYIPIEVANPSVNAAYFVNDGVHYYIFTSSAVVVEKHMPDDYKGYTDIILDNSVSIALTTIGISYDKYSSGTYYWYSDSYHKGFDEYSVLIITTTSGTIQEVSFIKSGALTYWRGVNKSMTVNSMATSIAGGAFTGSGVESIKLGDKIKEIEGFAFLNEVSLTSITIENSTKKIGEYAFNGCENLKNITFNGVQAEWNEIQLDPNWREGSGINKVTGIRFVLSY